MNSGGILSFIMKSPKKWLIGALIAVGAVLLILGSLPGKKDSASPGDSAELLAYAESLEERIAALCEEVEGVSDVSVLLTLDGSTEHVYAENSTYSGGNYVVISVGGEERMVLVREIYSSVRGIAVVCRGGEDIAVRRTLTELLSCALGVPISKISIAGAGK